MLHHKKGFTSIFANQKQPRENSTHFEGNSDSDCNISECSSYNSCEENQEKENKASPIRISCYSSDEDEYNKTRSWKLSAKKRRLTPKRPLSDVHIRRNVKQTTESLVHKNNNISIINNSTPKSQWQKVRNVFQPVKRLAQNASEKNTIPHNTVSNGDLSETEIDWTISDNEADESSSQHISTPSTITQKSDPPTELDLFIALIDRESSMDKSRKRKHKLHKKSCLKGGLLHDLQRTLETAKTDCKFLKHDKKFGIQTGICVTVLELQSSFGVHMATVEEVGKEANILKVIIDAEMAKRVKVGDKLEAFLNDAFEPYFISKKDDFSIPLFVQPNKLLLL